MNITHSKNVFIYGVCGRSSSTALQRILNSSDEIFIFGEHHQVIEKLVNCYFHFSEIDHERQAKEFKKLIDSFENKLHTSFYANATNNMLPIQAEIKEVILKLLQPPLPYSRIGYKEISVVDSLSLRKIQRFFPNSYFIFLFRNPLKQWGSVGYLKSFWDYSKSLDAFLREYARVATIYLNTPINYSFFLENTSIRDEDKMNQIIKMVEIEKFDSSLLGKTISTTNQYKVSRLEKARIMSSKAFRLYQEMQKQELQYRLYSER